MSGIALDTVNPVVFDDPVYCCEFDYNNRCPCLMLPQIIGQSCDCGLFGETLEHHGDEYIYLKCQECKDHYQRVKG